MESYQNTQKTEEKDIRFAEPTFIDPLTRLYNQYYLYQFLPEEIKKAKLGNYALAVFMIDLDGFKNVNDTYGHLCGDEVLRQMAEILKKSVRQTDMVIRYAGDEFTVLLPGVDLKRVERLSQQLVENVAKNPFKGIDGQDLHLTISMGFSMYPDDGEQIDTLIELADKALYLSKQRGKNRVSQAKEVTLEEMSALIAMDSFPCQKFIDRQEEIQKLKHIFDTLVLHNASLQLAFIFGDIGTGKSRLLEELNKYAQDSAVVISCRAALAHRNDPYFLFAQSIAAYIEKIGIHNPQLTSLLANIPSEELAELSRIIPVIAFLVPNQQALQQEDKKTRFLLFKGFFDFLIELNQRSPIVCSFDDLQWADKASIELLRYLCKQEKNKRIFIVCSFSEDTYHDKSQGGNLKEWWEDLVFADNSIQLKLSNLSLEDVSAMIDAIFPGMGADNEFCHSLYTTTKGNPSFIEEVLKSLVENSVVFYQDNRWQIKKELYTQGAPFSVEEIIKKRLKNLDEETKEMIVQAAVIGEDFSIDLLKKIDNRDEGFMLELLSRAKKMHLIGELEQKGKFGFINKNIQHMLYNELNDKERSQLHGKIIQVLGEEHKDNLYNVAGEMAFHYTQSPQQDNADAHSKVLLEKTAQLFSPAEIVEYFDNLAKEEVGGEEKAIPLPDEKALQEAIRFIRALLAAVKIFHLYPPGAMRMSIVKEAFSLLENILKEAALLRVSEVERSLLINGERPAAKETEQSGLEGFLHIMREYDIKSVSFKNGILPEELNAFFEYISAPSSYIKEKGGWADILNKGAIKSIKVVDARFAQSSEQEKEFSKKDKLKDIMFMEFLLGKIGQSGIDKKTVSNKIENDQRMFAPTVSDADKEAFKKGKAKDDAKVVPESIEKIHSQILGKEPQKLDDPKKLARLMSDFEPEARSKVIQAHLKKKASKEKDAPGDILREVPEDSIVEALVAEYRENQGNLIVVKECFDKAFANDEARKKTAFAKLEDALLKSNAQKRAIAFIGGELEWNAVALAERLHTITTLPNAYYSTELGKIQALLEELSSQQKRQELEKLFSCLLTKASQLDPFIRKEVMMAMAGFVKTSLFTDAIDSLKMQDRLESLWLAFRSESQPKVFSIFLDIFREACRELAARLQLLEEVILEIEKPEVKKYSSFIRQLCVSLSETAKKEKSSDTGIYKLIEGFVRDVFYGRFLEVLAYNIISVSSEERVNFKGVFPMIHERLADTILHFHAQKDIKRGDSFHEYAIKKGSAGVLLELGEPALLKLAQKLSQAKEDISLSLLELIKCLNREELIDPLSLLVTHKNYLIRRGVILALGSIGTEKAAAVLAQAMREEKDKRMRMCIKDELHKLKTKR